MEVITIDSKAFKELENKISAIAEFIFSKQIPLENEDEKWVDSEKVCKYLVVSGRTLQRLRTEGLISFTPIKNKYYYKIGEIKRVFEARLIKSTEERLRDLIFHAD